MGSQIIVAMGVVLWMKIQGGSEQRTPEYWNDLNSGQIPVSGIVIAQIAVSNHIK